MAVVPFADTALAGAVDPAAVAAADLERSGRFRALPRAEQLELPTRAADVDAPHWRLLKVDYLVVGRPICKAASPRAAARAILDEMQRAFDQP